MALTKAKEHYPHIAFDKHDVPIIQDTTMKVIDLVTEKLAYGWSPEEIHFQHPYLTIAKVHAALTYYWDHVSEFDKDLGERMKKIDAIQASINKNQSPVRNKLKAKGIL